MRRLAPLRGALLASALGARAALGGSEPGQEVPDPHAAHRAAAAAVSAIATPRVMAVQPLVGDLPFVDQDGRGTTLREAFDTEGPLLVNFIFTTCTTVCPIMSTGFSQLREALGPDRDRVRLVSISIDPESDSVEALQAYARRYGSQGAWRLLTGTREASVAAQRAFSAFRGDKMNHVPATYVRRTRDAPWEVLDGLSRREALLGVWRELSNSRDH